MKNACISHIMLLTTSYDALEKKHTITGMGAAEGSTPCLGALLLVIRQKNNKIVLIFDKTFPFPLPWGDRGYIHDEKEKYKQREKKSKAKRRRNASRSYTRRENTSKKEKKKKPTGNIHPFLYVHPHIKSWKNQKNQEKEN